MQDVHGGYVVKVPRVIPPRTKPSSTQGTILKPVIVNAKYPPRVPRSQMKPVVVPTQKIKEGWSKSPNSADGEWFAPSWHGGLTKAANGGSHDHTPSFVDHPPPPPLPPPPQPPPLPPSDCMKDAADDNDKSTYAKEEWNEKNWSAHEPQQQKKVQSWTWRKPQRLQEQKKTQERKPHGLHGRFPPLSWMKNKKAPVPKETPHRYYSKYWKAHGYYRMCIACGVRYFV